MVGFLVLDTFPLALLLVGVLFWGLLGVWDGMAWHKAASIWTVVINAIVCKGAQECLSQVLTGHHRQDANAGTGRCRSGATVGPIG